MGIKEEMMRIEERSQFSADSESSTGPDDSSSRQASSSDDNGGALAKNLEADELNVRYARRLVETFFVLCACAVTVLVFIFARKADQTAFELEVCMVRFFLICLTDKMSSVSHFDCPCHL